MQPFICSTTPQHHEAANLIEHISDVGVHLSKSGGTIRLVQAYKYIHKSTTTKIMSQTSPTTIPLFYRLFFQYLDPLICVWGAYMDFFDPRLVLSSHIPSPHPDIGHAMILKQRGGGMLNFGFVSAVLLRYTYDLNIWNIVQVADFLVDVAYFWAVWEVLGAQGRLGVETWRKEDWGSVVITGTAGLVRMAFLARVGFGKGKTRREDKRL